MRFDYGLDNIDRTAIKLKPLIVASAWMVNLYVIYVTYVAFAGGRIPLLGIETDGGIASGLIWIFLGIPITIAAFQISVNVIFVPLLLLIAKLSQK